MKIVNCYMCSNTIEVRPSRMKKTKRFFCSRKCQSEWQRTDEYKNIHKNRKKKKREEVFCTYCGNKFIKKRSHKNKNNNFCNKDCRNAYNAKRIKAEMTKEKIKVNCFYCGKEKFVHESVYKNNKYHFCCRQCYWNWRKENIPKGKKSPFYNRITKHCQTCNKEIEVIPFVEERNNYHFCSQQCYWKWNMNKSKNFNPNTKPQIAINELLDSNNIKYENEYFCDFYFIDNCLLVGGKKFFIEVNGTFWHVDNRKFKTITNDIQLRGINRDREKRIFIKENYDIDILYIWEEDIMNNINLCERLIFDYINNNGFLRNYHSFNYIIQDNKLKAKNELIIPYMDWDVHMLNNITNIKSS